MATEKTPNYSPLAIAAIVAAVAANDGVANKTVAEALALDPVMNVDGQPRKARSIIAKMRRMADDDNFDVTYEKVKPTTKSGEPVTNKVALVKQIAEASGIVAAQLDGLENAPKKALELLAGALAA